METTANHSILPGLGRLQSSASVLVRGIDHRAELASLELSEAKDRAIGFSGLLVAGIVTALLTGFALDIFVAALWWDTPHRLLAIGILVVVQAVVAVIAFARGFKQVKLWHPLFQTINQLKKDTQCLRDLLTSPNKP